MKQPPRIHPAHFERATIERLLREARAELGRLRRIRGAYRVTARRIARTRTLAALAASLLGAPLAGLASAEPEFMLSQAISFPSVSGGSSPSFGDIDGDGDLDAFIGASSGSTFFFENTGTASVPAFTTALDNPFGLTDVGFSSNPTFADIDGDGDLDAFIGEYDGSTFFFENTGTAGAPAFAASVENPFGLTNVFGYSAPSFGDIDGDGDLDAFVGQRGGYSFFFENTGTANAPAFAVALPNPFGLIDVGYIATPTSTDIDGDGDLDLFVGSNYGTTSLFENVGVAAVPLFAARVEDPFGLAGMGYGSHPAFVDIDGDGDLDAFIGVSTGETHFFEDVATSSLVADEVAAKIKLRFNKVRRDTIRLKVGGWVLPGGFSAAGKVVLVNVGGSTAGGALDAKGRFKSPDKLDTLKLVQRKKDGTWTLRLKRKKGAFAQGLRDEGMLEEDNAKPGKPVRVVVSIDTGAEAYGRPLELLYTSKDGKQGTAK